MEKGFHELTHLSFNAAMTFCVCVCVCVYVSEQACEYVCACPSISVCVRVKI